VFVFGGFNASEYVDTLRILNLRSLEWFEPKVAGKSPSPRGYHASVFVDHRLWVIGGYDGNTCFPDVHVLELGTFVSLEKI